VIERARREHADALATLHRASLPASLLSALGQRALVRYYTHVIDSPRELVLVAIASPGLAEERSTAGAGTIDDGVVGGCVLSNEPHTLLRRFVTSARMRFAVELARAAVTDRSLRARLWRRLRERGGDDGQHLPEITQIFTDARQRGRGIGADLLRSCEEALRVAGQSEYIIHTHRDDNDAGIRFYRREGFATMGETTSFGDSFLLMKKAVR